jgi:hypothetical protein
MITPETRSSESDPATMRFKKIGQVGIAGQGEKGICPFSR